jgi:ribosomal protein S18 acetylase RimI-like enzyme
VLDISVRIATRTDLPRILELESQFGSDAFNETQLKRCFTKNRYFCVLIEDDYIIGYAIVNFRSISKTAYLYSICLDKKYQGKKYGKNFLIYLESKCISENYGVMKLHVNTENKTAINLYRSLNYLTKKTVKKYYENGDAYLMQKNLFEV